MKRCPQCDRGYADDTLSFCLDDGTPLRNDETADSSATAILHRSGPSTEHNTLIHETASPSIHETEADSPADSGARRAQEGFWIAVLPFKISGTDPDLEALADGISEDITTGFSRFSYLKVIARSSVARFRDSNIGVRALGSELGARYLLEGSLRKGGNKLRISVQLVDTVTRANLWAETYDREYSPETIFDLQDDLAPRIVSTVADMHGVLPRSMSEAVSTRPPEQLSPYEAVLRSFSYFERLTKEELEIVSSALRHAVEKKPGLADAWAMLALLRTQVYSQEPGRNEEALKQGLEAAQKAVETDPSNHLAHVSLAQAQFFQRDLTSFRNAAERAVALNPADGSSIAALAELMVYAGDRERGIELAAKARQLNPNHPGWYWFADFYNAYVNGEYREALEYAQKINMPGHYGAFAVVAAACGQLGEKEKGRKALDELLRLRPDFATQAMRSEMEKWFDSEYSELMFEGLQKAGLEITD
jgi:TolB-like protein